MADKPYPLLSALIFHMADIRDFRGAAFLSRVTFYSSRAVYTVPCDSSYPYILGSTEMLALADGELHRRMRVKEQELDNDTIDWENPIESMYAGDLSVYLDSVPPLSRMYLENFISMLPQDDIEIVNVHPTHTSYFFYHIRCREEQAYLCL